MRVAKRVYALHAFHPLLQSTFVPAHNKRPRKVWCERPADEPSETEELGPEATGSQPQHETHGIASSHLAANGVFVGQQSQQPDFEAQGRQKWADRNSNDDAQYAHVAHIASGWTLGQPEMSGLDKVCTPDLLGAVDLLWSTLIMESICPGMLHASDNQSINANGHEMQTAPMNLCHGNMGVGNDHLADLVGQLTTGQTLLLEICCGFYLLC